MGAGRIDVERTEHLAEGIQRKGRDELHVEVSCNNNK